MFLVRKRTKKEFTVIFWALWINSWWRIGGFKYNAFWEELVLIGNRNVQRKTIDETRRIEGAFNGWEKYLVSGLLKY